MRPTTGNALTLLVRIGACAALAAAAAGAREIKLKDGTVLQGEILAREDSLVIIRGEAFGDIKVRAALLVGEDGAPAAATRGREPSDQALFFLPTAFTPPRGSFVFRDFELLFLTFGYSPTQSTSITGGFLFPVTTEAQLLTLGFKQQLWHDAAGSTAVAVTGNWTKPVGELADDGMTFLNGNVVAGRRFSLANGNEAGMHAALGYLGISETQTDFNGSEDTEWRDSFSYGFGLETTITPHVKLMGEYLSAAPFDPDNDFSTGFLTVGFRLHGSRLAADIAGIRPITDEDLGSFFLWPLLVVSYRI